MKRYISILLILIMLFSLLGCTASPEELVDNAKSEISGAIDEAVDEAVDDVKKEANDLKDKNITQPLNNTKNSIKEFFSGLLNRRPRLVEDTTNNTVTIYNSKGEEIIEPDVDTIADAKYKKKFKSCKEEQRADVIRLFMINRGVPVVVVDFMGKIDIADSSIPLKKWADFENVLATAGTDFTILELYANMKGDETAEKAFGVLGKGGEIIGNVSSIVKSILLFKGLTSNDLKDSTEYCTQLIEAIASVSDIVGIDYFSESLETVKVGVEVLIESHEKYYGMIDAYGISTDKINASGRFTQKRWSIVAQPDKWEKSISKNGNESGLPELSLEMIAKYHTDLKGLSEEEKELLQKYIIFRLEYELEQKTK